MFVSGFFRRWNKVQWKVLISYQLFPERHQQSNIIIILSCAKVTFIRYLYQETAVTSIMMPWWSSSPLYLTFTFPRHLSNFYFTFQKDVVDLHCIKLLFKDRMRRNRKIFVHFSSLRSFLFQHFNVLLNSRWTYVYFLSQSPVGKCTLVYHGFQCCTFTNSSHF